MAIGVDSVNRMDAQTIVAMAAHAIWITRVTSHAIVRAAMAVPVARALMAFAMMDTVTMLAFALLCEIEHSATVRQNGAGSFVRILLVWIIHVPNIAETMAYANLMTIQHPCASVLTIGQVKLARIHHTASMVVVDALKEV